MSKLDKNIYFKELSNKFNKNYLDFYKLINENYSFMEVLTILKAYDIASSLHAGQKRKSGEDYIIHPLNISYILAEQGFDYETICAALLHDTVEDTNYTLDDVKNDFGCVISNLVDGVTKMKGSDFTSKEEEKIATHKKILDFITKDSRIIAIKLADRLHNMYTLDSLKYNKQIEIATETKDFYVNLARFLGVYQIKDELQDLSLFILEPEKYLEIYELRKELKAKYYDEIEYLKDNIKQKLDAININMDYNYKIKNIGAINEEFMQNINLYDIKDLLAIRMIVENVSDCYKTLGVIHSSYNMVPNSFYDYIATPKYNGYKSLNTNIKTNNNSLFQIRIRTKEMQRTNSLGIVSNWSLETQEILNEKCSSMFLENKKEMHGKSFVKEGF